MALEALRSPVSCGSGRAPVRLRLRALVHRCRVLSPKSLARFTRPAQRCRHVSFAGAPPCAFYSTCAGTHQRFACWQERAARSSRLALEFCHVSSGGRCRARFIRHAQRSASVLLVSGQRFRIRSRVFFSPCAGGCHASSGRYVAARILLDKDIAVPPFRPVAAWVCAFFPTST